MTGQEMIQSFGLNYASEINASVPGFENSEILGFLNQAQDDMITELCVAKAYDKIESLRTRALNLLLSNDGYIQNMKRGSIDFDFFWITGAFIKISRTHFPTVTTPTWYECRDFNNRTNVLDKYTVSEGNKPVYEKPIWFKHENKIAVMVDTYSLPSEMMTEYIRIPNAIANDTTVSEVDVSMHPKIVDRAVTLAIETLANPRIQTQPQVAS